MTSISQLTTFLENTLKHEQYTDLAMNGLQVGFSDHPVKKVAVAVDSGLSIIEEAVQSEADLLLVHHGLFWGALEPITGVLGKKIKLLADAECGLFASHLPLDGHIKYGNAAQMAALLNLKKVQGFFDYQGMNVGIRGVLPTALSTEEIRAILVDQIGNDYCLALPFGKSKLTEVGIVTGSGSAALKEGAENGIELLISGEPKQECYHTAQELKINALFVGHYASETLGVKSLATLLENKFSIETFFIDQPTGI